MTVSSLTGGAVTTRQQRLAPSDNWSFVWPWQRDRGTATRFISAAWLGLTLVLVGYWAGAAGGIGLAAAVVPVAALALIPPAFGLPATSAADWIAAALGFMIGFGLGSVLAGGYIPMARRASGP